MGNVMDKIMDEVMDGATCIAKDCDKPSFLEYYVCAEHFVVYADPRYTESMLVKVTPETCLEIPVITEAASCNDGQLANWQMNGQMNGHWPVNSGQIESSAVESAEPDTETRAKTF
jgi:hypothetical protein